MICCSPHTKCIKEINKGESGGRGEKRREMARENGGEGLVVQGMKD